MLFHQRSQASQGARGRDVGASATCIDTLQSGSRVAVTLAFHDRLLSDRIERDLAGSSDRPPIFVKMNLSLLSSIKTKRVADKHFRAVSLKGTMGGLGPERVRARTGTSAVSCVGALADVC